MVRIELSNSYTLVGPKSNLEKAKKIISDMENEMKSEYNQSLENGGESAAMDARDDIYWENGYKEILSEIGFEMI
jgi:vacuolar-type H+-ATPase subunit H